MEMTLPVFDEASIAAARAALTRAERSYDAASECGDFPPAYYTVLSHRIEVARKALTAVAVPAELRARRFSNVLVQYAENRRVEEVAKLTAARDTMGIEFHPVWIEEGVDVSEPMIAWPNGEVETLAQYENAKRLQRLAANPYL